MDKRRIPWVSWMILGLILAGCQTTNIAGYSAPRVIIKDTPKATDMVQMITATSEITPVLEIQDVVVDSAEPIICGQVFCQLAYIGRLHRPIRNQDKVLIDWSYPYASTNNGSLNIHHGVEFQNAFGTIVLATADGEVVFAGEDDQTILGLQKNYYGNVVVLRHPEYFEGQDIYTLYGHLSKIHVEVGEWVKAGAPIGEVGASGVANGPHLHFEVRFEVNDYDHTVNPALWFSPLPATDVDLTSALAGMILNGDGKLISEAVLTLEQLDDAGAIQDVMYLTSYHFSGVNAHPVLGENFAISDLLPGDYRLSFVNNQLYEYFFTLEPGSLGFISLQSD